jgi:hypothetical protein
VTTNTLEHAKIAYKLLTYLLTRRKILRRLRIRIRGLKLALTLLLSLNRASLRTIALLDVDIRRSRLTTTSVAIIKCQEPLKGRKGPASVKTCHNRTRRDKTYSLHVATIKLAVLVTILVFKDTSLLVRAQ